jgi:pilus assembly protein CpaD
MKHTYASTSVIARFRIASLLIVTAAALGACKHTEEDITASVPIDYRDRHPIVVQEAERSIDVFVGTGRGGLTAPQRTDVAAFAQTWLQEATGPIAVDVPVSTPNARAASQTARDIQGIMSSVGVPARGVTIRQYTTSNPMQFATIRLSYPKITADAGPCGRWPEDLGPTIKSPIYQSNRPHWNHGCAAQRNLAAMVANPSDLVQPRPESPTYTTRRTTVLGKYVRGEPTAAQNPDADKNKLSDVAK